jgi:hypothetical protein
MLSHLLWSLLMDDLVWKLNNDGYYTVGYAILNNGKFLHTYQRFYKHLCALFNSGVTEQIYPSTLKRW